MDFIVSYGWYALLTAVVGEMVIPFILAPFYKGYRHSTMAISTLGNKSSPVRKPFNLWMLLAGLLFLSAIPSLYHMYYPVSKLLIIAAVICIAIFAVGACIFSCFFSVNETKGVVTLASKIHGIGSAIGFMLLLFVPLFLTILSFKSDDPKVGILSAVSFVLALFFFALFVMADKPEFRQTIIAKEGLWQRLNLFFMYFPLGYIAVKNIFY